MKKMFLGFIICCLSIAIFGCSDNQESKKIHKKTRQDNFKKVKIGSQIWMAENMNVSTFRNEETIPMAQTEEEWKRAGKKKQPAWCYYENDKRNGDHYGKLYNYFALNDSRGFPPKGWHIPTDADWKKLEKFLGENPGFKMKSINGWFDKGNGTNESGFSGFPGGYRSSNGIFYFKGENGYWWIYNKTKSNDAVCCNLNLKYNFLIRRSVTKETGFSVRCVKD